LRYARDVTTRSVLSRSTRPTVPRRIPQQRRAHETVAAVLDAVARILRREGIAAITTNRIAQVAGVSIGSVYQYFPDKRAIFDALHERHAEDIGHVVERALIDHAESPLAALLRGLIDALIDAHAADPELHLVLAEVPHRADGDRDLALRLRRALHLALAPHWRGSRRRRDLQHVSFVTATMIAALAHAAIQQRPASLSLPAAKAEALRAVLGYLGERT
jgi:AcrR family transcriptional regulator